MRPATLARRPAARLLRLSALAALSLAVTTALAALPPPSGGAQPPRETGGAALSHQITTEPVVDLLRDLSATLRVGT